MVFSLVRSMAQFIRSYLNADFGDAEPKKLNSQVQKEWLTDCKQMNCMINDINLKMEAVRDAAEKVAAVTSQVEKTTRANIQRLKTQSTDCRHITDQMEKLSQQVIDVRESVDVSAQRVDAILLGMKKVENDSQSMRRQTLSQSSTILEATLARPKREGYLIHEKLLRHTRAAND